MKTDNTTEFQELYCIQPNNSDAFETVRRTLVEEFDKYQKLKEDLLFAEARADNSHYSILVNKRTQHDYLTHLVEAAIPFFPDGNLEFFTNLAYIENNGKRSQQILVENDLTQQEKYLLSGIQEDK